MAEKRTVIVHGDGVVDDTEAMQAIFNGEAIGIRPDGTPWGKTTDEVINWLASVCMDARAPHHQWPIYDQMLREIYAILRASGQPNVEIDRLRKGIQEALDNIYSHDVFMELEKVLNTPSDK